jgi:hypothetical protein
MKHIKSNRRRHVFLIITLQIIAYLDYVTG